MKELKAKRGRGLLKDAQITGDRPGARAEGALRQRLVSLHNACFLENGNVFV